MDQMLICQEDPWAAVDEVKQASELPESVAFLVSFYAQETLKHQRPQNNIISTLFHFWWNE